MIKMIMHGCNGKMGQVITNICKEDPEIEIVAGIDPYNGVQNEYPVFADIAECKLDADVVVDFAAASAVDALLDYCVARKMPVVLCTTGLSEEQIARVETVSREIPVLKSANMSLGINMLLDLLQKAANILAPAGFDMEIVEKHCGMCQVKARNLTKDKLNMAVEVKTGEGGRLVEELMDLESVTSASLVDHDGEVTF